MFFLAKVPRFLINLVDPDKGQAWLALSVEDGLVAIH
jgi:hypothetical protein